MTEGVLAPEQYHMTGAVRRSIQSNLYIPMQLFLEKNIGISKYQYIYYNNIVV